MKRVFVKVLELLFSERCAVVRKRRMDKRTAMQAMLDTVQKMRESGFTATAMNISMYDAMWSYNRQLYADVPVKCRYAKVRP